MFENLEFWGFLITLLARFSGTFAMLFDIRGKISDNSERITRLETKTSMEFDKCRLHKRCEVTE